MNFRQFALVLALASVTNAFAPNPVIHRGTSLNVATEELTEESIMQSLNYKPGKADTEFAKKFGHLAGKEVKTVGEAFSDFTSELGFSVNALYKNSVTDLVGTTHLIVANARFQKDPIWSTGLLLSLDLLLKNYPEKDIGEKIASALFKAIGLDEAEVRGEAKQLIDWSEGKTKEEIEAALSGEGDNVVAETARAAKSDEFWMYSRYFGLGLLKMMEIAGLEMEKDEAYPIMEDWMKNKLEKSYLTACSDSDLYFRVKDKLDMMETMMKEIEIREKKRMAERLEAKAEAALKAAEKEAEPAPAN
mmetsp:Transcript_11608/g.17849  ORF Transcript_11608/g.17849 Transcript_11608/m.17849 type:complete len:304 (-) Transcript_11608:241-1152(-)